MSTSTTLYPLWIAPALSFIMYDPLCLDGESRRTVPRQRVKTNGLWQVGIVDHDIVECRPQAQARHILYVTRTPTDMHGVPSPK
jgi:hypothetical protein